MRDHKISVMVTRDEDDGTYSVYILNTSFADDNITIEDLGIDKLCDFVVHLRHVFAHPSYNVLFDHRYWIRRDYNSINVTLTKRLRGHPDKYDENIMLHAIHVEKLIREITRVVLDD